MSLTKSTAADVGRARIAVRSSRVIIRLSVYNRRFHRARAAYPRPMAVTIPVMFTRRQFWKSSIAAGAATRLLSEDSPSWGGPVLDIHLHMRQSVDAEMTHM